jgi:hypothetical protein
MRDVFTADTAEWLKSQERFDAVVTSLPDAEETNMTSEAWEKWFVEMVAEIIKRTESYAVFYQTDRKIAGRCIDKSYLVHEGARIAGANMMWHKIMLRRDVGKVDLFRPTYTHLLCFSRTGTSGTATPDVLHAGEMIYKNAMGLGACRFAVEFIKTNSDATTITDPFCGRGSVLAVANSMGLDAVGVEILPEYAAASRELELSLPTSRQ